MSHICPVCTMAIITPGSPCPRCTPTDDRIAAALERIAAVLEAQQHPLNFRIPTDARMPFTSRRQQNWHEPEEVPEPPPPPVPKEPARLL